MTAINAHSMTDTYELANGVKIPVIGFGTWQSSPEDAYQSVKWALDAGYRHIDTAATYDNEQAVGRAIRDAGVPRDQLFVTTKLWNEQRNSYDDVLRAFQDSLTRLGLDYIDLYLIHWPEPAAHHQDWQHLNAETWRAMEHIFHLGKARAIGVSNFLPKHLKALAKTAKTAPMVNQIFLNPYSPQPDVVQYNRDHGMLNEAYSPLGTGELLKSETVAAVAKKHGKSPAQVLIRWSLEQGFLPLPKSVHQDYIKANADVFDFELDADDHQQLAAMAGKGRQRQDPTTFDFSKPIPFLH
ncbi:aldo/keto reductase [Schleiferilactobacillus shenzhenensis]|nr:aldo/keto reductase [Schleiferilactobacillus shenzhenensis]